MTWAQTPPGGWESAGAKHANSHHSKTGETGSDPLPELTQALSDITANAAAVVAEAAARAAADTTLQTNITTEASTRATNDTTENSGRIAADTAIIATITALGVGIVQTLAASASGISSGTSLTDIVTQAITTHGGRVIVVAYGKITEAKSGSNDIAHSFQLYRDTTPIGPLAENQWGGTFGSAGNNDKSGATVFVLDTPGTGTFTYRIKGLYTNWSTSGTPTGAGYILVIELSV